jgi:hypothetical protein
LAKMKQSRDHWKTLALGSKEEPKNSPCLRRHGQRRAGCVFGDAERLRHDDSSSPVSVGRSGG